jgi:hypothetical protein
MFCLRDALLIASPFVVHIALIGLATLLGRQGYARDEPSPTVEPPVNPVNDVTRPSQVKRSRSKLGKIVWLAYVLWLFPLMVPATWLSKRDICPKWVIIATPILYAALLYFFVVRAT